MKIPEKFRLKFYVKERELFPYEFKLIVDNHHHVKLIVGKLCRHYNISISDVIFTGRTRAVYFKARGLKNAIIRFPKKIDILMICHEVAHHYNLIKKGNNNHSKKLMTTIKRFVNYCRTKDYWGYARIKESLELNTNIIGWTNTDTLKKHYGVIDKKDMLKK